MKNKLIQKLQILLRQQGALESKQEIYAQYGVTSSKDMSVPDLIQLINRLEGKTLRPQVDFHTRLLRSEVLKLLTTPATGELRERGLGIPNDWGVLNPFIANHGGKSLPEMTTVELSSFKAKLYAMRQTGWHYKQPQTEATNTVYCPVILPTTNAELMS